MYKKIQRIINISFLFFFVDQAYATSTYSIATANRIGKAYAYKIKKEFPVFNNTPSIFLCNKFILQDIQSNNKRDVFLSDYLIKHYNEDFVLRTFTSCVKNLDLMKIRNILKDSESIEIINTSL